MAARAEALNLQAEGQIATLIDLASGLNDDDLGRSCPGREKLGDGTVGTLLAHTADNYLRIAALAGGENQDDPAPPGRVARHSGRFSHLVGGWRRHRPRDHGHGDLPAGGGGDADELRGRLSTAREKLGAIAALDDPQLDSIPPAGAFRFCDGKRNLEEVLTALLTHQGHQVEALARS